MKQQDFLDPSGHLEIYKVYEDGSEDKVFSDPNTITSGMGVGLGLLYAGSGASNITDFQIRYFQLGVSGDTLLSTYGVSETMLASALGQENGISDYRSNAESALPIVQHQLMAWDGNFKGNALGGTLWYFGLISDNSIKRVDLNSVTYILYIDRNSCNDVQINEIGLFMSNPLAILISGQARRSPLVAYRTFNNIKKTNQFSLVFKWKLSF